MSDDDVRRLEAAFDALGEAGAKARAPVSLSLEHLHQAITKYERITCEGRAVPLSMPGRIDALVAGLHDAVDAARSLLGELPADAIAIVSDTTREARTVISECERMQAAVASVVQERASNAEWLSQFEAVARMADGVKSIVLMLEKLEASAKATRDAVQAIGNAAAKKKGETDGEV